MRWTEADMAAVRARMGKPDLLPRKRASKLNNERIEWQGQKFDSKKELRDFQTLEQQRSLGAIRAVVRQVSLPLPGSRRRIRIDFMVVENGGRIRWFDTKGGFETQISQLKRAQVREAYGIDVEVI